MWRVCVWVCVCVWSVGCVWRVCVWVCVCGGGVDTGFTVDYAHCYKYRTLFTEQCCTEVKVQRLCSKILTFLARFPDSVSHTGPLTTTGRGLEGGTKETTMPATEAVITIYIHEFMLLLLDTIN